MEWRTRFVNEQLGITAGFIHFRITATSLVVGGSDEFKFVVFLPR